MKDQMSGRGEDGAIILGAGMTGLCSGIASGWPIFEAAERPGGICSSYYMRQGGGERLAERSQDGEDYRFEIGGGHWIFGGDSALLNLMEGWASMESYERSSAVYFPENEVKVPYPLQNHLRFLTPGIASQALREMAEGADSRQDTKIMREWLKKNFGQTLCDLFFDPFHEMYTAGLWKSIAPQDPYKSPVNLELAAQGAIGDVQEVGYNTEFTYPYEGLNALTQRMAEQCTVHYGKRVTQIDTVKKLVTFADGSIIPYNQIISTLPLNKAIAMTQIELDEQSSPSSSVLVVNIGAKKGRACPDEHWIYTTRNKVGFHRVGFYSNVDSSFLLQSDRSKNNRVGIYVEMAYPEGKKPGESELAEVCKAIVKELQEWNWIDEVEVVDPTWIEVAYTWSWPDSHWREKAIKALDECGIHQAGRYARWTFQGIAESIAEGLLTGTAMSVNLRKKI